MENTWTEQLQAALRKNTKTQSLYQKYHDAFHASYQEETSIDTAVSDILCLETLSETQSFSIQLYQLQEKLHIRLFQFKDPIPLSDILPMLENMGLRTLSEQPYEVKLANMSSWISDFTAVYEQPVQLDIQKVSDIFQDAFMQIQLGICENDNFNKLVLGADLAWREVTILRTYAKYLHQTGFRFNQSYIADILSRHIGISKDLIQYFKIKFNPKHDSKRSDTLENVEKSILNSLDAVTSLDEDRILRRFLLLIKASLRTNYFQKKDKQFKTYLSIKFKSDEVPGLPLPHPLYEIFVYSPRLNGIHLRGSKVARGGIRWSDRPEDFRTEILGLMKTQTVKNAVIVPSGAKGGFVLKALSMNAKREEIKQELLSCYKNFIRGLLDITDNIKAKKIVHPDNVICYDDEDPYLVVAADKGTADFSDVANSISQEYDFWLGDAFASGGSIGYNHKQMGITARGAWESIRRLFRDGDINIDKTIITVVGIGDMSGDVFGNGLIYSSQLKLVGAFDHRHIFIDPNPDLKKSYEERLRLFKLPTSSWENYNPKLISAGGGVFARSLKSISISKEMKKILDIQVDSLSPTECVSALLKAPVDLLYNGGIGTFVKASTEYNEQVGDKANEFTRVNGNELRCRMVGEGGNLGFTQLGRIEYAMNGGLINTDFIDNSAGVDCSDHEVNIKILLDKVVNDGKLTVKKRNTFLAEMKDEVAKLVLKDNADQVLAISLSSVRITNNTTLYQAFIKELETTGDLNREVEFLPDDKTILERKAAGKGFTRPEIAILLAYSKIVIKHEILKSKLPEEPYFKTILLTAFPDKLKKHFQEHMKEHRLQRDIIATQLSNQIVNEMGSTFVYRMQTEMGASVSEVIHAYSITRDIFQSSEISTFIDSLRFKIPVKLEYDLLHQVRHLLNLSTRWFLRSQHMKKDIAQTIRYFLKPVEELKSMLPDLISGNVKSYLDEMADALIGSGIDEKTASKLANYRVLYIFLNVVEIVHTHKFDLFKTAKTYFEVGSQFNFIWFREQIAMDSREGYWNNLARLNLRDELDLLQKTLTIIIMQFNGTESNIKKSIHHWMKRQKRLIGRWEQILQMLHGSSSIDYTMFFIALRELRGWIQAV